MIWTNLHIYIMYYVGMTCITGSLWTGVWYIAMKFLEKKGSVKLIYGLLKLTMIGYAIPLFFFAKLIYYIIVPQTGGLLWCVSPLLYIIITVLFVVWLSGIVVNAVLYFRNYRLFKNSCKVCYDLEGREKQIAETLKKELHIKRKVKVCRGFKVNSPFASGFIKPCIFLPDRDFSEHSLEVLLTHELTHIKHNDVFWKPVFGFLHCVFWFNPLVWKVADQYRCWVEAHCDDCCYSTYFSINDYFGTILTIIQDDNDTPSSFAPGACEEKGGLLWRVKIMDKFRTKKLKVWMAVLVVVSVLACSVGSTYAVGVGAEKLYSCLVDHSMKSEEEELQLQNDEMQEYYGDISELGDDIVIFNQDGEIVNFSDGSVVSPQSANGTLRGTLGKNDIIKSGAFRKTAGSSVFVAVTVSPSGKTVQAGLIYPTGVYVYVQGTDAFSHTFGIPSDGAYMVFVKNVSDTTVTVNCIYQ